MMSLSIGLDIAKSKIDICCDGKFDQISNDKKSITKYFKAIDTSAVIVMEATGKYHREAQKIISELGITVEVVNPFQSKHFAKAMNILCKTDKVDAKILALYGEKMDLKKRPCPTELNLETQDLSRHLDDLKKLKLDLENRKREATGFVTKSLTKTIDAVDKEIDKTEEQLITLVKSDNELSYKLELLTSIPGIGQTTAITLLSYLRELGSLNKREISALAGLAPVNHDSGLYSGKRRIRGGRRDIRSHLFMPILGAATQHNKRMQALYKKHVDNGKPKRVALIACMRKLVVWANAILATGEKWRESFS